MLATVLVSFSCAMQVQTFRKVNGHSYASTMCIGNLRSGTAALSVYLSMGKSYKILREMNKELSEKGFLTIAGKIPVEYFREKWYGGAKEVGA